MDTKTQTGRGAILTVSRLVLNLILVAGGTSCATDAPGDASGGTLGILDGDAALAARVSRQCRDGIDNDSDGKIDYPADPGCSSRNDDSENSDAPAPTPTPTSPTPTSTTTDAASVDTTRMPVPPQSSTVIDVTSPITISGTVTDVTYNVTGSMSGSTAISLGTTGRLERVRVNVNGNATNGVSGGTLKDVYVTGATYAGIAGAHGFEGVVFATNNYADFLLSGSGVTLAADAMIKSANVRKFSFLAKNLTDGHFDGAIVGLTGAGVPPQATTFECWTNCQRNVFNIIIADKAPGYGLAIYGGSADNIVNEFLGNGVGGDPGISIGGGSTRNVITKATVNSYTVGVVFGEDVDPPPYANAVHTLIVSEAHYGCVFMNRGSYNNVVGDVGGTTCFDTGGADVNHPSSVYISNSPNQTNVPPHDNQVLGLAQSGQLDYPSYAVYLGSGTTGNTVSGTAKFWTVSKVLDQGSGNTVNVQ